MKKCIKTKQVFDNNLIHYDISVTLITSNHSWIFRGMVTDVTENILTVRLFKSNTIFSINDFMDSKTNILSFVEKMNSTYPFYKLQIALQDVVDDKVNLVTGYCGW